MVSINETIQRLKLLIKDENCARMNRSIVKGFLGELLVKAKLEAEGLEVTHLGNQSGFDLKYINQNRSFEIDVKYSETKCDFEKSVINWGWALQHENKKKPITCSHFVCLAVDVNQDCLAYYVVNRQHLHNFGRPFNGRFKKVNNGLAAFETAPTHSSKTETLSAWKEFEKQMSNGWLKKISHNQTLSEIIGD